MELKEALSSLCFPETAETISPSHVAWVPCVSGHLDFALMRVGLNGSQEKEGVRDDPNYTINYVSDGPVGGHPRNIVLESWVDWKDSEAGDGKFRVILTAEANNSRDLDGRSLKGQLFLYPKSYEEGPLGIQTSEILTKIRVLHKDLLDTDCDPDEWSKNQQKLNEQFDELKKRLNSSAPFGFPNDVDNDTPMQHQHVIDFWVAHNGLTFLSLREKDHPKAFEVDEQTEYTVIRQAFYYIKYGLHTHKHHDFERDALTTVIPLSGCDLSAVWLQLAGQLKRELVRIKRTQSISGNSLHVDDVHAAEGVLAYSRTLLSQLRHHIFLDEDCYQRELANLNGIEGSLTAHVNKAEQVVKDLERKQDVERHWGTFFIAVFGAVGIAISNVAEVAAQENTGINYPVMFGVGFCLLLILCIAIKMAISFFKQRTQNPRYVENLIKEKGFFNNKLVMSRLKISFSLLALYTIGKGVAEVVLMHLPIP